ncbi:HAMP domain-containing protein [Variovorax sp. LjRoot175]|uniref:HAMP domain-containing protein n=1 Tax=Variovorax sp. LjRoot175 TaxID=3342276 RepID=UPI003ECD08F4
MVGLGSILVAALLTFFLARALLRRLRDMAQATHQLAAGDYASRIAAVANDELGALAGDFNRMAQTLEHAERARRGFMADISHELRTPLAVLRAQLEAIQDGIRSPTVQSTNAMHLQVERLGRPGEAEPVQVPNQFLERMLGRRSKIMCAWLQEHRQQFFQSTQG